VPGAHSALSLGRIPRLGVRPFLLKRPGYVFSDVLHTASDAVRGGGLDREVSRGLSFRVVRDLGSAVGVQRRFADTLKRIAKQVPSRRDAFTCPCSRKRRGEIFSSAPRFVRVRPRFREQERPPGPSARPLRRLAPGEPRGRARRAHTPPGGPQTPARPRSDRATRSPSRASM